MLLEIVSRTRTAVPRSRLAGRLLFGIDFVPAGPNDYHFDVTTLVLVRRMLRVLKPGEAILDLGTGSTAVVGLALWKHLGCRVVASDIDPELVELARRNVEFNGGDFPVIHSRYLGDLPREVETVVFNPPYVPTPVGLERGLSEVRRSQWNGGPTGGEVIREYLVQVDALDRAVTTHLAVNYRHIPREAFTRLLEPLSTVRLSATYRHPLLPVDVHTIANRPVLAARTHRA